MRLFYTTQAVSEYSPQISLLQLCMCVIAIRPVGRGVQKNPPFLENLEIFDREVPPFGVCNLPDKHNPLSKNTTCTSWLVAYTFSLEQFVCMPTCIRERTS